MENIGKGEENMGGGEEMGGDIWGKKGKILALDEMLHKVFT